MRKVVTHVCGIAQEGKAEVSGIDWAHGLSGMFSDLALLQEKLGS